MFLIFTPCVALHILVTLYCKLVKKQTNELKKTYFLIFIQNLLKMKNLTNISEIENLNAIKGGCGGARRYYGGNRCGGTPTPTPVVTTPPARQAATMGGGKPA